MDYEMAKIFNWMLALVLSLSCHEWAHAWVAKLQGDPTAEDQGRLTLNPIAHIDIVGTLILPLIMILTSGGMFGWARPVPIDLRNLRHPKWGHVLIAAAGPIANLVLCFFFVILATIYTSIVDQIAANDLFLAIAKPMIHLNAILAVFNLIPIAPLDGGTVFPSLLPQKIKTIYDDYIAPYGMMILLALMISGGLKWVSVLASGYISVTMHFATLFV